MAGRKKSPKKPWNRLFSAVLPAFSFVKRIWTRRNLSRRLQSWLRYATGTMFPLIVNDNFIAAMKSGADGVHVGIEDAPVKEIRRIAGENFIIGATARNC